MSIDYSQLRIGDRLVREKENVKGFSKHHLLVYERDYYGRVILAENHDEYGVRLTSLDDSLRAGKLVRIEPSNLNELQQQAVIARVNKRLGWSYDLINYNCETFVNDVLKGMPKSYQVQAAAGAGVAAIGLTIAVKSENTWLQLLGGAIAFGGAYLMSDAVTNR